MFIVITRVFCHLCPFFHRCAVTHRASAVKIAEAANLTSSKTNSYLYTVSEGQKGCHNGLMPRVHPPPHDPCRSEALSCLPELACGSDLGSKCCNDGPACFGTDGYGTSLKCIEGVCVRCGLRGTPPCDGAPPLTCAAHEFSSASVL
jgi:hypothetical protein